MGISPTGSQRSALDVVGLGVLAVSLLAIGVVFLVLTGTDALKGLGLPLVLLSVVSFLASGGVILMAAAIWRTQSETTVTIRIEEESRNQLIVAITMELARVLGQVRGLQDSNYERITEVITNEIAKLSQNQTGERPGLPEPLPKAKIEPQSLAIELPALRAAGTCWR